jgi:hypothetical protein
LHQKIEGTDWKDRSRRRAVMARNQFRRFPYPTPATPAF